MPPYRLARVYIGFFPNREIVFIPRISMIPSDLPFSFKRLQFPVKVSFAITINKAQGLIFKYVGVDLRTECFSHGQLYVAFSRTGDPNHLIILILTGNTIKTSYTQKSDKILFFLQLQSNSLSTINYFFFICIYFYHL
jgi:ATP-dependent DNA helicase PIF1